MWLSCWWPIGISKRRGSRDSRDFSRVTRRSASTSRSVVGISHLDYYERFALLRMLVIQARFMKLGLMPREPQSIEDNVVARLLQRFVDG